MAPASGPLDLRRTFLAPLLVGNVLLLLLALASPARAGDTAAWSWTTLPVGHGDAHVLIDPDNRAALIDAASTGAADVVGEYLRCRGVERVHTLVLTHPHWDHIGGTAALLEDLTVERVWAPELAHSTPLHRRVRSALERHAVPRHRMRRGETGALLPGVLATVLNPGADTDGNLNHRSLAMRFAVRGVRFLAMADVVGPAELELLEGGYLAGADVLKVAHHGDAAGSSDRLLDRVRPRLALIPAPLRANDPWGYPHRELTRRLERHGVRWFQTGRHGYLRVRVPADGPPGRFRFRATHDPPCP